MQPGGHVLRSTVPGGHRQLPATQMGSSPASLAQNWTQISGEPPVQLASPPGPASPVVTCEAEQPETARRPETANEKQVRAENDMTRR